MKTGKENAARLGSTPASACQRETAAEEAPLTGRPCMRWPDGFSGGSNRRRILRKKFGHECLPPKEGRKEGEREIGGFMDEKGVCVCMCMCFCMTDRVRE